MKIGSSFVPPLNMSLSLSIALSLLPCSLPLPPPPESVCLSSPCLNGGTCAEVSAAPGYTCRCLEGFEGDQCEVEKTETSGGLGETLSAWFTRPPPPPPPTPPPLPSPPPSVWCWVSRLINQHPPLGSVASRPSHPPLFYCVNLYSDNQGQLNPPTKPKISPTTFLLVILIQIS